MSISGSDDALGIQKALEDQAEVDRIDVGDAHAVRHEAAGGRPAPGTDRNPLLPRVADEVPDDQEVPGYFIRLIISISYESALSYSSIVWRSVPAAASCCNRINRCLNPSRATCSK